MHETFHWKTEWFWEAKRCQMTWKKPWPPSWKQWRIFHNVDGRAKLRAQHGPPNLCQTWLGVIGWGNLSWGVLHSHFRTLFRLACSRPIVALSIGAPTHFDNGISRRLGMVSTILSCVSAIAIANHHRTSIQTSEKRIRNLCHRWSFADYLHGRALRRKTMEHGKYWKVGGGIQENKEVRTGQFRLCTQFQQLDR